VHGQDLANIGALSLVSVLESARPASRTRRHSRRAPLRTVMLAPTCQGAGIGEDAFFGRINLVGRRH
jgi:hypothetical protein